jgi:hypothetical protein
LHGQTISSDFTGMFGLDYHWRTFLNGDHPADKIVHLRRSARANLVGAIIQPADPIAGLKAHSA